MYQNWMKLSNKLKLTVVGGLTVSASLVSALTFLNLPGSSNSLLAQDNSRTQQNGNTYGNQQGSGSSQGGRDNNSTNNSNNRSNTNRTYNRNRTYDQRQQRQTTNNCQNSRGASCGDGNTLNNDFRR